MPTVLFYNPPLRAREDPTKCLRFSWHKKARVHPTSLLRACSQFGPVVFFAAAVKRSFAIVLFERESDASLARAAAMAEQMPGLGGDTSHPPFGAASGVRLAIEPYGITADLHVDDEAALRSASHLSELLPLGWTGPLPGMIAAATAAEETALRVSGIAEELAASRDVSVEKSGKAADKDKENLFLGVAPPFVAAHMLRRVAEAAEAAFAAVTDSTAAAGARHEAASAADSSTASAVSADATPFLAGFKLPSGFAVVNAEGAAHPPIVAGAAAAAAATPPAAAAAADPAASQVSAIALPSTPVGATRYLVCTAAFPPAAARGRVVPGPVPGLTLIHDFVSEAEEAALLQYLDRGEPAAEAAPAGAASGGSSVWEGGSLVRRVQHYGHGFDYITRKVVAPNTGLGLVGGGGPGAAATVAAEAPTPTPACGGAASDDTSSGSASASGSGSSGASGRGSAHSIRVMPLEAGTPLASLVHQLSRFGFLGTQSGAPDALPRPPIPDSLPAAAAAVAAAAAAVAAVGDEAGAAAAPSSADRVADSSDDASSFRGVAARAGEVRLLERCQLAVPLHSKTGLLRWLAEKQGLSRRSGKASTSASASCAGAGALALACAGAAADATASDLERELDLERFFPVGSFPLANQITVNEYRRGQGIAGHVDTHEGFGDGVVSLSLAADVVMEFTRAARDGEGDSDDDDDNDDMVDDGIADGAVDDGIGTAGVTGGAGVAASATASLSSAGTLLDSHSGIATRPSGAPMPQALQSAHQRARGLRHAYVLLPRRSLLCIRGAARFAWAHAIPARTTDFIDGRLSLRPEWRVSITLRRVWPDGRPCACRWPSLCRPQAVPHSELFSPHLRRLVGVSADASAGAGADASASIVSDGVGGGTAAAASAKAGAKGVSGAVPDSAVAASGGVSGSSSGAAAADAADAAAVASVSVLRTPALESRHVHALYDAIAPHFSSTRHSPWPRVESFMRWLPPGSVVVDAGCGNGKYLGIRRGDGLPEGAEPGAVPPTHLPKGTVTGKKGAAAAAAAAAADAGAAASAGAASAGAASAGAASATEAASGAATAVVVSGSQCIHSVGFDRSAGLVAIAAGPDRRLEAGVGDALCLPVRPGCADAVLSIAVLHHISSRQRRVRLIAEALRAVRPADAVGRALLPHGADSLSEADRPAAGVATGLVFVQAWALEQGADSKRHFVEADTTGTHAHGAAPPAAAAAAAASTSASAAGAAAGTGAGAGAGAGDAIAAPEGKDVFVPWHLTLPFLGAAAGSKKAAAAAAAAAAGAAVKGAGAAGSRKGGKRKPEAAEAAPVSEEASVSAAASAASTREATEPKPLADAAPAAAAAVAVATDSASSAADGNVDSKAAGVPTAAPATAAADPSGSGSDAAAAIAALADAGGAVDATRRAVVFQRYCHMYRAGELEALAAEAVCEVAAWQTPNCGSATAVRVPTAAAADAAVASHAAAPAPAPAGSRAVLLYSARAAAALAAHGIVLPAHLLVPPQPQTEAASGFQLGALAASLSAGCQCAVEVVDSWWERDNWCMLLRRLR